MVTTVLSSMPTYHLTVFPLAVWVKKLIKLEDHSCGKEMRMSIEITASSTGSDESFKPNYTVQTKWTRQIF
jgi:hypothetical protein